jgi:hypothetical protein
VLDLTYRQDVVADDWFWPKVPHGTRELVDANRQTVASFVDSLEWHQDAGDERRTTEQIHLMSDDVSLARAYEELLMPLRLTDENDSQLFTGMLLQLKEYLQNHQNAACTIYRMSQGRNRVRSVNDDEEIPTLFQGANFADAAYRDQTYPGDDRIRAANELSIQIHMLEVREKGRGPIIDTDVPAIAVWVPGAMARDWLVQAQR